MQLADVIDKTCVIGLSYFSPGGELLRQTQLAGRVRSVDAELGITLTLMHSDPAVAPAEFILPPDLRAWFNAPTGRYRHAEGGVDVTDPSYLVTWDVHRRREGTADGQHEWWDWVPNLAAPRVGG